MLPINECQILLDSYAYVNFMAGATIGVILGVIASFLIVKLVDKD
jgi:hypothetical protein